MSEKKYPFPKKTGTLQKHNFKNKLDIFLSLFCARKGIYKYNDNGSYDSEKRFKIDTTSEIGHIYINNQDGEHMSWIEVENTLNEQQATIEQLERKLELKTEEVEYLKRMMVKWGMVKDE